MSRGAALVALALVGCDRPAPARQPAGLDTLAAELASLSAAVAHAPSVDAARPALAAWQVPAARWPALVTAPFRGHHPAAAAAFDQGAPALLAALRARGPRPAADIAVRWQYADDPELAPDQARLRVALPVGRPGAIAFVDGQRLAPIFVHDGQRWRALIELDRVVVDAIAAAAPTCVAPYRAAVREPCLAMSAPVISAALAGDRAGLDRACARLRLAGCELPPVGDVTPRPPAPVAGPASR